MIVYKEIEQFDVNTGKSIGKKKVYDHEICDFTGERIEDWENPNAYEIDYCSNDPSFGDMEGEDWLFDLVKDNEEYYHWELFSQRYYRFKTKNHRKEVFEELLKTAKEELDEIYSLDHLLRWSRGRMLEKVIKSGKYKLEQFLENDE